MQTEYTSETGVLSAEDQEQLELLFSTPKGTVVLDREFGIDRSCLDQPLPMAQTMLATELSVQIPKYIPDLELSEVRLIGAKVDGSLYVKVVVRHVE